VAVAESVVWLGRLGGEGCCGCDGLYPVVGSFRVAGGGAGGGVDEDIYWGFFFLGAGVWAGCGVWGRVLGRGALVGGLWGVCSWAGRRGFGVAGRGRFGVCPWGTCGGYCGWGGSSFGSGLEGMGDDG